MTYPVKEFNLKNSLGEERFNKGHSTLHSFDENGKKLYVKHSRFGVGAINDAVHYELSKFLGFPHAKTGLATIKDGKTTYGGVWSENFMPDNTQRIPLHAVLYVTQGLLLDDIGFAKQSNSAYFDEVEKLPQDMNLLALEENFLKSHGTEFFEKYLKDIWLPTCFYADVDTFDGHNTEVLDEYTKQELNFAPLFDKEYSAVLMKHYPYKTLKLNEHERTPFTDLRMSKVLNNGIHPNNIKFLKEKYPKIFYNFCYKLLKLQNSDYRPGLEKIFNLESTRNFLLNNKFTCETKPPIDTKPKLKSLGQNALRDYIDRSKLYTSIKMEI